MPPLRSPLFAVSLAGLALAALLNLTPAADENTTPPDGLRNHTPAVHALVGARIIPTPGQVIERGTLIIRDGVIAAVGSDVPIPDDARVQDLAGKSIYPGLIDAYSELPEAQAPRGSNSPDGGAPYWNSQVVPQFEAATHYKAVPEENKKLRSQGIALRLLAPAHAILKGTSVLVGTGDGEGREAIVREAVALHVRLSPDVRGRGQEAYPASPMGAMALVRQAFYDADWYRRAWQAHRDTDTPRPEKNDALEVLQNYPGDGRWVVIDAPDELYFLRADQVAREFRLNVIVRGSGDEYRRLEAIRGTGRSVIVPLDFPPPPSVRTPEEARNVSLERLLDWDLAPENPGRLARAGVKIALTSHGLKDRGDFLAAVRKSVRRGLEPEAALRALTIAPAELFGVSNRVGTLQRGKMAHLVVTDGDLFDSKTKVLETWVAGRRYEAARVSVVDARGVWELTVNEPLGQAATLRLEVSGSAEKLSGRLVKDDIKGKFKYIALEEAQLGFHFKGDDFGWPGIIRMSAAVSTDTLDGWGVWADGQRFTWTGRRLAKEVKEDPKEEDSKKKPPENQADEKSPEKKSPENKPPEIKPSADAKKDPELIKDKKPDVDKKPDSDKKPDKSPPESKPQEGKPPADAKKDPELNKGKKPGGEKQPPAPDDTSDDATKDDASEKKDAKSEGDEPRTALYPVNFPLGAYGVAALPEPPKAVLFRNATVWTSGPQGILEKASVLVQQGKIIAIGADVAAPAEALVVDLAGKHLAPGIIDCHSHSATDSGINEATQTITAEVRIGDYIDADHIEVYRQLAGGVTTINVLHGSANTIGGQNQVLKLRWGALPEEMKFKDAPAGIKFALGENVKQSNWGDKFNTRYPQSRMGVEQIVRDEFRAARDYQRRWSEWRPGQGQLPPRIDLELEAIAEVLSGKRLIHCHSYRQDEILAFLRTCEEFKVRIATLQHILEGYKVADAIARHGAGGSAFSDWWAYKVEVYDAIPYNGAVMHEAGVVVSFNSDSAELARRLNTEAAKAVKYGGLSEVDALRLVTLNPARQLQIDRWTGSIEPGKDADLAVWSDSPLSTLAVCDQTWIDGRKYFDRQDDLDRRQAAHRMRSALIQRVLSSGDPSGDSPKERLNVWDREDTFCHHGHGHE